MKLKSVTLTDFKRFTNLTIDNIPESARLIMLAGPNGCGKSSFLDALYLEKRRLGGFPQNFDDSYYVKIKEYEKFPQQVQPTRIEFHDTDDITPELAKKCFYFRSAYRNEPDFKLASLGAIPEILSGPQFSKMSENDVAVSRNYQRLVSNIVEELFGDTDSNQSRREFVEEKIGRIRNSFNKIFPEVHFCDLSKPLENGTFRFNKGSSRNFLYKNLSGGEKSVFDLVLDLMLAISEYDNTVFCIDEPELHMNTATQAKLLTVLYELIPENCQMILATHSVGMMRRAHEIERSNEGSVIFLDFDGKNFDDAVTIGPIKPTRTFWEQTYKIAFDDLSTLLAPKQLVICEGTSISGSSIGKKTQNQQFDAYCYTEIFKDEFPDTCFVSCGNSKDVSNDRHELMMTLQSIIKGIEIIRLIDRDDNTEKQKMEMADKNIKMLTHRNIESYLFADEVLGKLVAVNTGTQENLEELLKLKREFLENLEGPTDDLKKIRQKLHVECRRILRLNQSGSDAQSFMRDILVPLIKPDMEIYKTLRKDIFE